jgi:hypothetical protein
MCFGAGSLLRWFRHLFDCNTISYDLVWNISVRFASRRISKLLAAMLIKDAGRLFKAQPRTEVAFLFVAGALWISALSAFYLEFKACMLRLTIATY